ncbi:D12 class N6 adenine-specific DNA methyltransferase [Rhodopseudomonas palustris]|uniref:DNA adenine methylase n=1 Tax=Rhodopseudomonas palustris TaxID=1076 RepID=UPI000D1A18A0|nr:DNA adenine methylase [Rhodopseudomonas palustris]AVT76619.1 D12 class N6 adenine-specific DNA methyltransferase [Rhodopseudomonas palustris]
MSAPTRPVLRWHGGKWRIAPWIISFFPRHQIYVEPFGGAASVLLRKPRSPAEVYNDLDGRLVNLFRVLRDPEKASELQRRIGLTLYARDEFEWSYSAPIDDVDDAHKMIVLSFMGHGSDSASRGCRTGFRAKMTDARALPSNAWANWHRSVPEFVERLRSVTIERIDAMQLLVRYDTPSTLLYFDPPYLPETRSSLIGRSANTHGYRHEMDREAHAAMLDALLQIKSMVVLSGYPDPLYDEMLCEWTRFEKRTLADGARERLEVLWINPACAAALDREHRGAQLELIGAEA